MHRSHRILGLAIVLFLLGGCHRYTVRDPNGFVMPPEQTMAMDRANLNRLAIGMTKDQVMQIMGTKTAYYHRLHHAAVVIPHPYKTGTATANGRNYEILYYLTEKRRRDAAFTPVVLEDNRVVGWGWTFVNETIRRNRIDVR